MQGLQQQQLQQLYLQHQQAAIVLNPQVPGSVHKETPTDSTKSVANHVNATGGNYKPLDTIQPNQVSLPETCVQNNWTGSNSELSITAGSRDQLMEPVKTDGVAIISQANLVISQAAPNSEPSLLLSQSLSGSLTQPSSLLTPAAINSSLCAIETSVAGDHPLLQNSIAGSEPVTLASPASEFISTASNVLLSQSFVSSQTSTFLPQTSIASGSSLNPTIDGTMLNEINSAEVKQSPLTGNNDPTLSNGPVPTLSGFSSSGVCVSNMSISPFSSPSYVMSPTQKSPFASTVSLSPSITQPLTIINPTCLSPSSGLQGGQSTFSPSVIPGDLLSPSKQLAVVSPGSSKSPFNLSSGGNGLVVPKLNLLFDPMAIPQPPPTPSPPLPTDKLSPQTPSIYVSVPVCLSLLCVVAFFFQSSVILTFKCMDETSFFKATKDFTLHSCGGA